MKVRLVLWCVLLLVVAAPLVSAAPAIGSFFEDFETGSFDANWDVDCDSGEYENISPCVGSTNVQVSTTDAINGVYSMRIIGHDMGDVGVQGFYANQVEVDGDVVLLYRLDESPIIAWTLLDDAGPVDNDLHYYNYSGAPEWDGQIGGDGRLNGGVLFDGIEDYAFSELSFDPANAGTIAFWVKIMSLSGTNRVWGSHNDFEFRVLSGGTYAMDVFGTGTVSTTTLDTGVWYHVIGTWDTSTNARFVYIDGVLDVSDAGASASSDPGDNIFSLGRRTGASGFANVRMDQFVVYDTVISSDLRDSLSERWVQESWGELTVNTAGEDNVSVEFTVECLDMEIDELDSFKVHISNDSFVLDDTVLVDYAVGNLSLQNVSLVLPEGYWGLLEVSLRFIGQMDSAGDICVVDDIHFGNISMGTSPIDVQVLAQGVSHVSLNEIAVNEWKLFVEPNTTIVTNAVCKLLNVNGTLVPSGPIGMTTTPGDGVLSATWTADDSVIEPGINYEVSCSALFGDLYIEDIKQFVFVGEEKSFWQNLFAMVLDIFNRLKLVQSQVNETLTIVQGLEGSVSVVPATLQTYSGESVTVMSVLSVGQQPDDNASCVMTVYYPNATVWLDEVNMTSVGNDGLYALNVSFGQIEGNYQAISVCEDGLLQSSVRGTATWNVMNGVRMQMVS